MASACTQRQKSVQIHDMQDHRCLNKRHIYQIRIDLSAIMVWHCLCHLGRNNNNKKTHHIFARVPVALFIYLSCHFMCSDDWCLPSFFPLSSLLFNPPTVLLSVHLLDMPALFSCSLQPNFLTHFLFPPWPCDQSLQDGIAVGSGERERGMKGSMVKEYRKRGVSWGMQSE